MIYFFSLLQYEKSALIAAHLSQRRKISAGADSIENHTVSDLFAEDIEPEFEAGLGFGYNVPWIFNHFSQMTSAEMYTKAEKLFTIYTLTGQNREEQSLADGRFILLKTDTTIYSATIEGDADKYAITQENLIGSFNQIYQEWNSGEM